MYKFQHHCNCGRVEFCDHPSHTLLPPRPHPFCLRHPVPREKDGGTRRSSMWRSGTRFTVSQYIIMVHRILPLGPLVWGWSWRFHLLHLCSNKKWILLTMPMHYTIHSIWLKYFHQKFICPAKCASFTFYFPIRRFIPDFIVMRYTGYVLIFIKSVLALFKS